MMSDETPEQEYARHFLRKLRTDPIRQPLRLARFHLREAVQKRERGPAMRRADVVPVPEFLRPGRHVYRGYGGPWIEERFFAHWFRSDPAPPGVRYLPVFWTDYYLAAQNHFLTPGRFRRSQRTIRTLLDRLDPTVTYFTLLEYDHPIWEWHRVPRNLVVFSAGGWGDVAIPLLKEPRPLEDPPKDVRLSFVGKLDGASNALGVRSRMAEALRGTARFHEGPGWRELMARSVFSLAPRGLGPTSFRLYEALSVSSIPIYLWQQRKWLAWEEELDWSRFSISLPIERVDDLPRMLAGWDEARIRQARATIATLYDDYFTYPGTCRRVQSMVMATDFAEFARARTSRRDS